MDYKLEGDNFLSEGKYAEYYNSYKKYNKEAQTDKSLEELNKAKKKYDLYKELCDFLKKDENNYYEILDIKKESTQKEIRDSYTKLMSRYHPDKTKIKESNSVSRILHKAYVILSNTKKRQEYDDNMKRGSSSHFRMKTWDFAEEDIYQSQIFRNRHFNQHSDIFNDSNIFNNSDIFNHSDIFNMHNDDYTVLNNILYRHFYRFSPNRRLERVSWNDQIFAKVVILILLSYFILFV